MVNVNGISLTEGAVRALRKHTREDGALHESVLGRDDAEELYFCSMRVLTEGGPRLCYRKAPAGGYGDITYSFTLTKEGRQIARLLQSEDQVAAVG